MTNNNKNRRFTTGLALNGGGMHYHYAIVMLMLLEKSLSQPLYKYFDIVAGTSAGSIMMGFTMPHPDNPSKPLLTMDDYIRFNMQKYGNEQKTEAERIFTPLPGKALRTIQGGPIYDGDVLENIMKKHMGGLTVNDALTNVMVPVINGSYEAIFIKNRELIEQTHGHTFYNYNFHEVIRAATAAPFYFAPKELRSLPDIHGNTFSDLYFDAGMTFNNPSIAMLSDIEVFKNENETPIVINIGFSKKVRHQDSHDLVNTLVNFTRMGMDSAKNSVKTNLQRKEDRGEIEYFDLTDFFDPDEFYASFGEISDRKKKEIKHPGLYNHLGNTSPEHLEFLKERAFETYERKKDRIAELVEILERELKRRELENDTRIITQNEKIKSLSKGKEANNNFSKPAL